MLAAASMPAAVRDLMFVTEGLMQPEPEVAQEPEAMESPRSRLLQQLIVKFSTVPKRSNELPDIDQHEFLPRVPPEVHYLAQLSLFGEREASHEGSQCSSQISESEFSYTDEFKDSSTSCPLHVHPRLNKEGLIISNKMPGKSGTSDTLPTASTAATMDVLPRIHDVEGTTDGIFEPYDGY
mmetsp:Transcript_48796/g.109763  ORF Transcript_48796/g.109763 Transcript_48796/m.109763 type:complete len:181 (-) Transcript_48796:211-753(-)